SAIDELVVDFCRKSRVDRRRHWTMGHGAIQCGGLAAGRERGTLHLSRYPHHRSRTDRRDCRVPVCLSPSHPTRQGCARRGQQSRGRRARGHSDNPRALSRLRPRRRARRRVGPADRDPISFHRALGSRLSTQELRGHGAWRPWQSDGRFAGRHRPRSCRRAGHAFRARELDAGDRVYAVRSGPDRLSWRRLCRGRLDAPPSARRPARSSLMLRRPFFWIIALVIAIFALAPAIGNDVQMRESLLLAAVYITLASNLNVMLGYAGYVNFGSIVFFGLGGYICVYFVSAQNWPLAAGMLAAGIAVSALAFLFGLGVLRLRGAFFALSTIGINEAVQAFVSNFEPWGGSSGIYLSAEVFQPLGGPGQALWIIYFLIVGVMGLSLFLSYAIKTSKVGLGLLAIGQNEDAAAILGVPTPFYKALAYSASAFLPAVVGGLYFFKSAFIQPSDAFDLSLSTEAMVITML